MASNTVHPCDERLPTGQLLTLGIQHVLVMYAGAVAVPLILGARDASCRRTRSRSSSAPTCSRAASPR